MNQSFRNNFTNPKLNSILNISKIVIISISALYLLGNFSPFYDGQDSYLYGIESIFLSQGIYEISNPLLQETGRVEFTGGNWNPTIHGTLIPIAGIGTPLLGAIAYTIGGNFGLFYLAPILGIVLLIVYERVITKLFGKSIGFLALLFFATCHIFFRSSIHLNTDAILTLFFVLGIFFLVKFFRNEKTHYILLASIFFSICCLVKITALVFFPLEFALLFSYFVIPIIKNKLSGSNHSYSTYFHKNNKKLIQMFVLATIPWILFFGFWFGYNDYFYGSPTSTYFSVVTGGEYTTATRIDSLLTLEQRDYDQAKDYSKYLLPYQISAVYNKINNNFDDVLGKNWPGLLILPLILLSLYLSFKQKLHRLEFSIFTIFIFGIVGFYSGQTPEWRAELGLPSRYMLPAITLSFVMCSFLIVRLYDVIKQNTRISFFKIPLILFLTAFFIFAFTFSPPIQFLVTNDDFTNPIEANEKYSIAKENLPPKSVILAQNIDMVIEYGVTPFRLDGVNTWNSEKISLLTKVLDKGYSVYIFKTPTAFDEKESLLHIINEHNVILKDYSKTFCQLHIDNKTMSSDDSCLYQNLKS